MKLLEIRSSGHTFLEFKLPFAWRKSLADRIQTILLMIHGILSSEGQSWGTYKTRCKTKWRSWCPGNCALPHPAVASTLWDQNLPSVHKGLRSSPLAARSAARFVAAPSHRCARFNSYVCALGPFGLWKWNTASVIVFGRREQAWLLG